VAGAATLEGRAARHFGDILAAPVFKPLDPFAGYARPVSRAFDRFLPRVVSKTPVWAIAGFLQGPASTSDRFAYDGHLTIIRPFLPIF
jgi:hypothetical protein